MVLPLEERKKGEKRSRTFREDAPSKGGRKEEGGKKGIYSSIALKQGEKGGKHPSSRGGRGKRGKTASLPR